MQYAVLKVDASEWRTEAVSAANAADFAATSTSSAAYRSKLG